ncbi:MULTISPECIES: nucleotidyltransferase family protein [unclassified Frankia]|uniref:nucleotidyltransferase family protein n=1 Tax=unclassified Frankia TaxID=2632575 RepID=UPI001EF6BF01|nr:MULTISPECIES: nucleotidyltransferase domain-containing protein [unclassified Frankia]
MRLIAGVEIDEGRLAAICDRYGIAELQLLGSQARGTATADSDILYTLQPGRRLGWDIEQLADDLADLFGRPVDPSWPHERPRWPTRDTRRSRDGPGDMPAG